MSLGQGQSAVGSLHERGVDVAAEAVDVLILGSVVKEVLRDGDAGKPGELLEKLGQRVDLELDPSVASLVEDAVGDAGGGLGVVRDDIDRGEIFLVSSEELDNISENLLHVCVVGTKKLLGEEVSVSGVFNALVLVSNGDGVERRDKLVPRLKRMEIQIFN